MKKFTDYIAPYRVFVILSIFLIFLQSFSQLVLPDLMAKMVDIGIVEGDIGYIYKLGIYMLIITIFSMICSVSAGYFISLFASGFSRILRRDLFTQINSFSLEEFDRFGTSTLVTRTTNDVSQIQNVILMFLRIVVLSPLYVLGCMILMLQKDVTMSLIVLAFIPLLGVFVFLLSRKIVPLMKKMQAKLDGLSRILRERLTGVRVIRAFNKEEAAARQYDESNADLTQISLYINRIMAILFPMLMFLMNMTILAVLWYGSFRIETNHMSIGDMMAFIQYVMMILMSVVMLSFVFVIIPRAKVSYDRIFEILNTETSIKNAAESADSECDFASAAVESVPAVEFKNVIFKYSDSDKPILKDISFSVARGETVAIIGGTGSGKTSLVQLLPRFYDTAEGSVLVGGQDVRSVNQEALRAKIGFVPQTAVLFSGTIADNVRYGKEDAGEQDIWEALRISQALEFVENMEDGLESYISQGGTNLSGGQKQRLTIARAIVKKPDVYIFDDNFSALDYKTDADLRHALKTELKDAAVIIVAQRVATIKELDKIIVLENGEIAGIGNDSYLMKNCNVYQNIVESQSGTGLHHGLVSENKEAAE
jgi:ABC-type multidrug transport system, ATPase and permease components